MKSRTIWTALFLSSFFVLAAGPAGAQRVSLEALAQQVQTLLPVAQQLQGLVARVTTLEAENTRLKQLLVHFSRNGNDIFITAANLHVLNGQNSTQATNGLGNIIIGYNESRGGAGPDVRTGSHMLVVGDQLNYSSFGGIVAGILNTASGGYSSVSGRSGNVASGDFSSIGGGTLNRATAPFSSVSGGNTGTASGIASNVSGGLGNVASATASAVSGGSGRKAEEFASWAAGSFASPQ
jgi:hypothetical protein